MINTISDRHCPKVKKLYMNELDFPVKSFNIMRLYIVKHIAIMNTNLL